MAAAFVAFNNVFFNMPQIYGFENSLMVQASGTTVQHLSSCLMLMKDVLGLGEVKQHLVEMVQQNRLSHALLFLGKEGSGALPLAIAFAQYVVCLPPPAVETEDLFGGMTAMSSLPQVKTPDDIIHQPSYSKADQLVHPDLHFSFPVITKKAGEKPTSKDFMTEWREFIKLNPYGNVYDWLQNIGAENKQGNITAEECNDIIRKLSLKSFESEYKILVMWMPEYLGKEGNKLLKLIEEPPPNTLFILVAEKEENIIQTIVSRCQLVKVPPLKIEEIEKGLIERNNISPEAAYQIACMCEGNYHEAMLMMQHADDDWHNILKDWLNATMQTNTANKTRVVDKINALGREKQKQLINFFIHLLEQSIRVNVYGEEKVLSPDNEKQIAMKLDKIATIEQKEVIIKELDKAAYYIERNANGKMLFMSLTIKMHYILKHKTLMEVN